ncbi:MAG: hypothetical protein Q8R15_02045 [Candidatus Micrarchaeota archaeon]|nr:hypothetical protein [Candidatus Micrarchaeota archaeon]
MNKGLFYFAAGVALLLVAGLVNADYYTTSSDGSASLSVNVAVNAGYPAVYTHSCSYSYYYGYYSCNPYSAYVGTYGAYCDPFDPYYSAYCYARSGVIPYSYFYPTYAVNPGTIIYTSSGSPQASAQQATPGPACTDGTPAGFCSTNYPQYCLSNGVDSQLIDKATLCGCPTGQVQDATNRNRCVAQTCSDGTSLNSCSSTKPKFCTSNANLVDRPSQCGCPSGTSVQGDACVALNRVCFVSSTSPSTIRQGETSVVTVSYSDVQSAGGYVNCGNGQVASLACSGGTTGTCTATCSYSSTGSSTVQAYVNGNICSSSSTVNTVSQLPSTGDVLARVTNCATNQAVQSAIVHVGTQTVVTDVNGEVRAPGLSAGIQSATATKVGYSDASATAVVNAGNTAVLSLCLSPIQLAVLQCDVTAEIAGMVTTNSVQNGVQLRLTNNNAAASNTATLSYSSAVALTGPLVVPLLSGESKLVTVYPQVSPGFSGSSIASVNVRGTGVCSSNLEIPLNLDVNGFVTLQALDSSLSKRPGEQACYNLLLRNAGADTGVHLAASSVGLDLTFDNVDLFLARGESRNARVCAKIPEGATGQRTINVQATSNVGSQIKSVDLQLSIAPSLYSNVLGCFNVNSTNSQFFEVKLTNAGGQSESFVSQLTGSRGFSPRLTQSALFNFVNQSTRSLYVQVDPSAMNELDSRATLTVRTKDSNVKVFEQELCFQKAGQFDSSAFLSPSRVSVQQGSTAHAFIHILNTGNVANTFEIEAVPAFQGVNLVSSRVSVLPLQEKTIEISVSPPNVPAATYIIPVAVYSLQNPASRIQVASLNLVVDVKEAVVIMPLRLVLASNPTTTFNQNSSVITLSVPVTNYEDGDRIITPTLTDLPQGWTYTSQPVQVRLPRFATTTFNFTIAAQNVQAKDYNATVVLTDEMGRQVRQPVVLPLKSNNLLTGLFVLGSTSDAFGFLVIVLVLIGLYLLYKAVMLRQEVNREHSLMERR